MGDPRPFVEEEMIKHLVHIAPEISKVESETWVLIVDTIILCLTIIGAFFILGGMAANEIRKRASTTRMRLVQSLVISDVMMGIVGLIGCTLTLNGRPLKVNTTQCDGLGVLFTAIIFSQHCWTLSLAFATFMILTKPLHRVTSWIEKYWYWSWLVVWIISFGVSVIGYVIYGYEPAGGICYYGNNTGIFGELIQFIPRAVVFLFISFFYGRLYVFLRRPDKIRSGLSDHSAGESSYSKAKHSWMRTSRRRIPFFGDRQTKTVVLDHKGQRIGIDTSASHASHLSKASNVSKASNASKASVASIPKPKPPPLVATKSQRSVKNVDPDIPPWERIDLPVFQIDGQTYGGSAGHGRESNRHEWRFSRKGKSSTPVPSAITITNTPTTSPLTSPTKPSFDKSITVPKPLTPTNATFDGKPQPSPTGTAFSSASSSPLRIVDDLRARSNYGSETTGFSNTTTAVDGASDAPSRQSSDGRDSSLGGDDVTRPQPAVTRDGPYPPANFDPDERRPSLPIIGSESLVSAWRRPSLFPSSRVWTSISASNAQNDDEGPSEVVREKESPVMTSNEIDLEKGFVLVEDDEEHDTQRGDEDDGEWDLKQFLANEEALPPTGNDPFVVTQKSENVEYVPESMASYLNRKTALLMLWFPLGYCVLFSVSLVHIIYDFAGSPPDELRAISRWMIFGQGLLDAIIYGVVEWHTKRVVRRRVRKGTFSPRTSHTGGHGSHLGSHLRGFSHRFHMPGHGHSHHHTSKGGRGTNSSPAYMPQTSQTQGESQIASRNRSPQVSFVDPESSIMQRLDVRKGVGGAPTLDEY